MVEPCDDVPARRRKKLSDIQFIAFDCLREIMDDKELRGIAGKAEATMGARLGQLTAPVTAWRDRFYERQGPDVNTDTRKKRFSRAMEALQAADYVQVGGEHAWLNTND